MLQEFKEFINRGGVIELAVAFVMGVAFKPIVDSLVDRVIMPLVGLVLGQPNFDEVWTFADGEGSIGAVITATVNFVLIAVVLFFIVKAYNRMKRPIPDVPRPEADPEDIVLLREIRDALVAR